jgi:hypothetical protein
MALPPISASVSQSHFWYWSRLKSTFEVEEDRQVQTRYVCRM